MFEAEIKTYNEAKLILNYYNFSISNLKFFAIKSVLLHLYTV